MRRLEMPSIEVAWKQLGPALALLDGASSAAMRRSEMLSTAAAWKRLEPAAALLDGTPLGGLQRLETLLIVAALKSLGRVVAALAALRQLRMAVGLEAWPVQKQVAARRRFRGAVWRTVGSLAAAEAQRVGELAGAW